MKMVVLQHCHPSSHLSGFRRGSNAAASARELSAGDFQPFLVSRQNYGTSCSKRPQRLRTATCRADLKRTDSQSSTEIQGLPLNHCNDFECTASPAVEQTIRSLARDVKRGGWTKSLFDRNVKYSDAYRSFQGQSLYPGHRFVASSVQQAQMDVLSVRLVGRTVSIKWRLTGKILGVGVNVLFTDFFDMNLVTSVVEKHSEEWDLSSCSPLGSMMFTATRMAWSMSQAVAGTGRQVDSALKTLSGSTDEGEDDTRVYANPNDPTKFFQQEDSFKQDAIFFSLFLAVIYVIFQGWTAVFNL